MVWTDDQYDSDPRIAALLSKGDPLCEWTVPPGGNYSHDDIDWLTALAADIHLFEEGEDSKWAAPIHAWHILAHFPASDGIPPLLNVFATSWDTSMDWNDWRSEELTTILSLFGEAAIGPLTGFLLEHSHPMWGRGAAGETLKKIAMRYPELREQCVARINLVLQDYEENDIQLNALLICFLMDLDGVEAIETIRRAFNAERVDRKATGTLMAVEIELGTHEKMCRIDTAALFGTGSRLMEPLGTDPPESSE